MGKITRLQLENFTCFAKLDLEFSSGVNVLIGTNGTGKTHILKVLYSACAVTVGEGKVKPYEFKLRDVFLPYGNNLERLGRHQTADSNPSSYLCISSEGLKLQYSYYYLSPDSSPMSDYLEWSERSMESVYIPVKEMLAHSPGFISLTSKREIAFEETYVDIIKQAYLPKLRILPNQAYEALYQQLGETIGGKVILKGEHFFLETPQGEQIEFGLLAEGIRKLALIWLLIQNGSLNPGMILFWDEPEANLNPSLVGMVVETILELQRQGVQVFLATHNYVLLKEFDLRKQKYDNVRYISLFREIDSDSVSAHTTEEYLSINPNAIAGTFSDLYKRDISRALQGSQDARS